MTAIFALHGGHLESFWQGCLRHGLRLTDFGHEASAGHAADGCARSTGRLGVCVMTSGPGFTHVITAITNAPLDGVPVLFIVRSPPLRDAKTHPLQGGIDQVAMALPTTQWAHRLIHTERIPELTAQAVRSGLNGRPGPVLLDLPIDVRHLPVDEARVRAATGLKVRTTPAPAAQDVTAIIELLQAAQRPAIFVGNAMRFAGAEGELRRFAEAAGIPVFCGGHGYGAMACDHPLWAKDLALLGAPGAMGQPSLDALLVVGARLGMHSGGRSQAIVPSRIPIAQVDPHAAELGRLREVKVPVLADARDTEPPAHRRRPARCARRRPRHGHRRADRPSAAAGGAHHRRRCDGLQHPGIRYPGAPWPAGTDGGVQQPVVGHVGAGSDGRGLARQGDAIAPYVSHRMLLSQFEQALALADDPQRSACGLLIPD